MCEKYFQASVLDIWSGFDSLSFDVSCDTVRTLWPQSFQEMYISMCW